jgi:hypothetical protein
MKHQGKRPDGTLSVLVLEHSTQVRVRVRGEWHGTGVVAICDARSDGIHPASRTWNFEWASYPDGSAPKWVLQEIRKAVKRELGLMPMGVGIYEPMTQGLLERGVSRKQRPEVEAFS